MTADAVTQDHIVIASILVIDDHPLYCDALECSLSKMFEASAIRSANTLTQGLKITAQTMPDLVMLDLKLPDVTGLSGFFKLKEKLPDVPVLVISADSSDETVQALMDAGAAGFFPKDASREILRGALERVQSGEKFLPDGFVAQKTAQAPGAMSVQEVSQRIAELTPQQSRIMALICAGKPNKQIAYELCLAEATVKAHITALLRRLGVSNRTQAAVLVNSANLDREPFLPDADARALLS